MIFRDVEELLMSKALNDLAIDEIGCLFVIDFEMISFSFTDDVSREASP